MYLASYVRYDSVFAWVLGVCVLNINIIQHFSTQNFCITHRVSLHLVHLYYYEVDFDFDIFRIRLWFEVPYTGLRADFGSLAHWGWYFI